MPKRFPEWVNTEVVIKAIKTTKFMDRKPIRNRKKNNYLGNNFNNSESRHCCSVTIIYIHNCNTWRTT